MTAQELRFSSDVSDVVSRQMDATVVEMRMARHVKPEVGDAGALTTVLSAFVDEVDSVLFAAAEGMGRYGENLQRVAEGFSDVERQVCEAIDNQERVL